MKLKVICLFIIITLSIISSSEGKIKKSLNSKITKRRYGTSQEEISVIYKVDDIKEKQEYTLTQGEYDSFDIKKIEVGLPNCLGYLKKVFIDSVAAEKQNWTLKKFMNSISYLLGIDDKSCEFSHFKVNGKETDTLDEPTTKVKKYDVTDCGNEKCKNEEEELKKTLIKKKKEKECPPVEKDCSKCGELQKAKEQLNILEIEFKNKICPPEPKPDCNKCQEIIDIEKEIKTLIDTNEELKKEKETPEIIEVRCPEGCCEQKDENGNPVIDPPYNVINENQIIAKLYVYEKNKEEKAYNLIDLWKDTYIYFKVKGQIDPKPDYIEVVNGSEEDDKRGFYNYKIHGGVKGKGTYKKIKHNGMYISATNKEKPIDCEISINTRDKKKFKKFFWPLLSFLGSEERNNAIDIFYDSNKKI